jgi:dienelactone hydrolase
MHHIVVLTIIGALTLNNLSVAAKSPQTLPGTEPLDWPEEDLSARLMDGAHRFVENQIRDFNARQKVIAKDETTRKRLRRKLCEIIGVVDQRLPVRLERFGDELNPALLAETAKFRVYQVRWPVLTGIDGEGLLAQPKNGSKQGQLVIVPDADQTPEELLGLCEGIDLSKQYARCLAENGFELLIPCLVSRDKLQTDDRSLEKSEQSYREWIYRQAFHMGRHIIGYEVQKVLAAVDWFAQHQPSNRIGIVGYAEGGLIAFYAAAIDPRIELALISGYFDSRAKVWSEPIYRNVWGLLKYFGDAQIASLILPRALIVEHSVTPTLSGTKGAWQTPEYSSVKTEFERISKDIRGAKPVLIHDRGKPKQPISETALRALAQHWKTKVDMSISPEAPTDRRKRFDNQDRHVRMVRQLENHVQGLVRQSEHVRDRFFLFDVMPELVQRRWSTQRRHETHSLEAFVKGARPFREKFHAEGMGRFEAKLVAPKPRSRLILETADWSAYDLVLDVYPQLFAWGVLLVPKDLKPGERRPVVVCQHGRQGLPRDTIDGNKSAYNNFAAKLTERGFITFAPHNLYRYEDQYRWLDRKANTIQASLFSFIIAQHDQILRWLESLAYVDPSHIAFYGLSYGGETAMRAPAILERYCLSICSGDFNQWTRKVAATDQLFSFMRTIEWEMPYWNLGHTFDYAEMAYLMIPRPFMVERGHLDLVGRDRWVAHEYAKVRWLYAQLGIADRTEIEFFQGGHSINGERTFSFLHKHLKWPEPNEGN